MPGSVSVSTASGFLGFWGTFVKDKTTVPDFDEPRMCDRIVLSHTKVESFTVITTTHVNTRVLVYM